jgi:hypothetical protein
MAKSFKLFASAATGEKILKLPGVFSLTSSMNRALKFLVPAMFATLLSSANAAEPKPSDPCSLLSKIEAAAVMGEIKGEPASKDGLRGKKCSYDNLQGAWVTIEVYPAEAHWDLLKNMATDAQDLTGLGDAAFSAKRGDTRQVYVKKGASMMEVDSSAGMDTVRKVAAIAVKRLP